MLYCIGSNLIFFLVNYVIDMIYIIYFMPQLIPFYFINQVTAAFAILSLMIYIFSKYSLPLTVRLFLARIFVIKL